MRALPSAVGQIGALVLLLALTVPLLARHLAEVYTSDRHLAVTVQNFASWWPPAS